MFTLLHCGAESCTDNCPTAKELACLLGRSDELAGFIGYRINSNPLPTHQQLILATSTRSVTKCTNKLTNLLPSPLPLPPFPSFPLLPPLFLSLQSNLQAYLSQRGQAAVDSNRVERLERAVASYRTQVQQLNQEKMALQKDTKVQYMWQQQTLTNTQYIFTHTSTNGTVMYVSSTG